MVTKRGKPNDKLPRRTIRNLRKLHYQVTKEMYMHQPKSLHPKKKQQPQQNEQSSPANFPLRKIVGREHLCVSGSDTKAVGKKTLAFEFA